MIAAAERHSVATVFEQIDRGGVVILDGAMGTELQLRGAPMDHVAWSAVALETHPELVRQIHEDYISAGADVIIANSFAASRHVLEPAGLGDRVAALNRRSVELAKAARERAGKDRDIAIAGSISSFVAEADVRNMPTLAAAAANYREQADLLAEAGVDLLILEMMRDVPQSRLAVEAATATGLPVWVGFTCKLGPDGTLAKLRGREREEDLSDALGPVMAAGGSLVAVMHSDLDAVDPALDVVFAGWSGPVAVYPHSGDWTPPNWQFTDVISPAAFATLGLDWVSRGVKVVGGCCGIGPEHIRQLARAVRGS
ncbi:MAG: homocysteine S-methyltransferase [Rhodospirillaceae bacterium]|nr:homocysteine S-methyltransferase [Rhodospirillaceae bacterium]